MHQSFYSFSHVGLHGWSQLEVVFQFGAQRPLFGWNFHFLARIIIKFVSKTLY